MVGGPRAEVDGSAWADGGERGGKLPGDAGRNRVDFRHAMYPVDAADLKAYALPPTLNWSLASTVSILKAAWHAWP